MDRCNDLCTKEATGACALCDALAERTRFERCWFKGGLFVDGIHAMQRRGIFAILHRYALPLTLLFLVGFMLWLSWFIPQSVAWHSAISRFVHNNRFFVIALFVSVLVPFFWLLLWKLPQWQVAAVLEMKDRIDLESKSRQTLAQILGGAALLIGLYFTSQTLRTAQEGQITDRFTKAITQLGDTNLAVRLGGIYALERIARDSASDHWSVMEVLTAFVREYSHGWTHPSLAGRPWLPPDPAKSQLRADIQAILTVIGRRTRTFGNGEPQPLDLHDADLQGAVLDEAQLQRAVLNEAQLQGASLTGAQLQGARLYGAQLQGASLTGAQLQGAVLYRAQLQRASLDRAQLQRAHLNEAQLQGAVLWHAQLQRANLNGADLNGAHLEDADLLRVVNLTQAQLDTACINKDTKLPEELTRPAPCLGGLRWIPLPAPGPPPPRTSTPTSPRTSIPAGAALMKATYGLHINAVLLWTELFALLTTGAAVVNQMVNYSHPGMASEMLGTLRDLWDTGQALSGLLGVACSRRYKSH